MDWLTPATSLMGRLRYRNKFLVILALFGIPLAVLAALLLAGMADRMTQLEERHAGLAQLDRLLTIQRQVAGPGTAPELPSLPPALARARQEGGESALRRALPEALADATDASGLITPDEPAVRYLVDLLADALPRHLQQITTLGERAREAAAAGNWTPDRFLAVDSALDGAADGLAPVMERAQRAGNHDPDWVRRSTPALDAYRQAVVTFTGDLRQGLVEPDQMAMGPRQVETATTAAVAAAGEQIGRAHV